MLEAAVAVVLVLSVEMLQVAQQVTAEMERRIQYQDQVFTIPVVAAVEVLLLSVQPVQEVPAVAVMVK